MYTNNERTYRSRLHLTKSKSTGNFYKQATERSLKYQSSLSSTGNECLACKHQKERAAGGTKVTLTDLPNLNTNRKSTQEEYYKTNDNNELTHLRKTKRYLEELLERTKKDFKKSVETFEKKLEAVTQELQEKKIELSQLQKIQNQKEAEQYYLANASLVQSYKQKAVRNDQEDGLRTKKTKELIRKNQCLEEELRLAQEQNREKRRKIDYYQLEMAKAKEYEYYAKQYESMKVLIDKMEEEKFQLLDRQHNQLEQLGTRYQQQKIIQDDKVEELRQALSDKGAELVSKQNQFETIQNNFKMFKDEQYETLRELLNERDQECLQLQSRVNCLDSELNFVKTRYGYLLKLAQNGKLGQSGFQNEGDEYCLERIGRYQISSGKESLMSMNISPIKHR